MKKTKGIKNGKQNSFTSRKLRLIKKIIKANVDCKEVVGYLAVYRVEFGTVMFFLLLALITIGVKSSKDARAGIQNGFWAIKLIILIGFIVAAFFIPKSDKFIQGWMTVGLIGSFLFIIVQLVLLIDFAHSWSESWTNKMEDSKFWAFALLFVTFAMYGASIAGIVCMYIYYASSDTETCGLEKFVISFELILAVGISVLSILPKIQEKRPTSGLLQAAAITLYTTFVTWSGLSYRYSDCNKTISKGDHLQPSADAQSIVGIVVTFVLVIYACIRTSSSSQIGKLGLNNEKVNEDSENIVLDDGNDSTSEQGKSGQKVIDDETEQVTYSYTFFHVTMIFASLYLMMTITNWYKPNSNLNELSNSVASFWIKMASSWLCIALYVWTLIAPVVLPDRDFD